MPDNLDRQRAIEIAINAILRTGGNVKKSSPIVIRKERKMRLDPKRGGWLLFFELDVPPGFEPNMLTVEVYDDETVYIPEHL